MTGRGFTVVELIITITIMGILLLLTVVNVNASQISARDTERTTDVEVIATALESFYKVGSSNFATVGSYATTDITLDAETTKSYLSDIDPKALTAPGVTDSTLTFIPATNNTQTTAGVTPQPTISQYVYQPIMGDGALCTSGNTDCRKFNLYYRLENDNLVYMIMSKNQ